VALCVEIELACRIERMAAKEEGRLLAEAGSGRLFRGMIGVASGNGINQIYKSFGRIAIYFFSSSFCLGSHLEKLSGVRFLLLANLIRSATKQLGGVFRNGSLASLRGGDHGGLQLGLLGGHLAASGTGGGPEGIFGGAFGGLQLADGGECHGWWVV
jgi:hypothetical protein